MAATASGSSPENLVARRPPRRSWRQPEQRAGHEQAATSVSAVQPSSGSRAGAAAAGRRAQSHPTSFISRTASRGAARPGDVDRVALEASRTARSPARPRRRATTANSWLLCGEQLLLVGRGQVLDQLDRASRGLSVPLTTAEAGQVHVRAAALLVGPDGRDREVGIVLELAAEVVGVREADVAAAVGDRVEHVGVRAEDRRVVGHPAPSIRSVAAAAVLGDPVGHERDVVLAGARAQAELVLPARVAEARRRWSRRRARPARWSA